MQAGSWARASSCRVEMGEQVGQQLVDHACWQVVAHALYAHQLRVSVGRCVTDLELIANASSPEEIANRVEFLPL